MQTAQRKILWVAACIFTFAACAPAITEKARHQARIQYDLGVASLDRGQVRPALTSLLQAVEKDPTLPEAHNALGLVLYALDKPHEALEHYKTALALRPRFSEAHNNLGTLYLDLKMYPEAIVAFEAALGDVLYGTPYLAMGNLGWAYHLTGDDIRALTYLERAVPAEPRFCRGYQWLTRIVAEQGDSQKTLATTKRFETHCVMDRNVAAAVHDDVLREMHYHRAMGYLNSGKRSLAKRYLKLCADPSRGDYGSRCEETLQALK